MVGISGRGRWGKDFFYYTCNAKRLQKKCDKRNVRRDMIEEEVTRAVLECVLDDDTVEWIANTAMLMSKEMEEQSQLGYYESRLKETKRQIANILRAVEMGIISDEFKDRMTELRMEKQELEGLIATEKLGILQVGRDDVIKYLLLFRNGDYKDKRFQKRVIRDFVKAVYVFEDHFKLVADFTGQNRTITRPLKIKLAMPKGTVDSGEGVCISSDRLHYHCTAILIQCVSGLRCSSFLSKPPRRSGFQTLLHERYFFHPLRKPRKLVSTDVEPFACLHSCFLKGARLHDCSDQPDQ